MRRMFWAGVVLAAMAVDAQAELSPAEVNRPVFKDQQDMRGAFLEFSLGYFMGSGTADRAAMTGTFEVTQPIGRNEVEAVWAFGRMSITPEGLDESTTLRFSNPFIAHHWVWRGEDQQLRVGLGGTVPAANTRDENLTETLTDLAAFSTFQGMIGARDPWIWRPETASVVASGDVYMRTTTGFGFGGTLKAAQLFGVGNVKGAEAADETVVQVDLESSFEGERYLIGLRATYVVGVISERDDADQISVEPGVRIRLGATDFVARFTLPIDEPYGFALDDDRTWGVHVGFTSPTEPLPAPVPDYP